MKLYLVETFNDQWLVRAKNKADALTLVDPQGYIRKERDIQVVELIERGIKAIIRHW